METKQVPVKEEVKKEPLSPEREKLEIKLKEIEIDQKSHDLHTDWDESLDQLLTVARCAIVDNAKSLPGSEVSYKSVWEDYELEEIKSLIMKKARKL